MLNNPDYIVGAGADNSVSLGAFLEVITALAGIGTAVTLFPIVKRQNEAVALGYVASRTLEAAIIVVGIVSLLSIVTLRQDFAGAAGADAASLLTIGNSLLAVHDWTFLLGPGYLAGIGNGLLLGYLMYTSGLVPRRMAVLGLSVWASIAIIPEFVWELSLGIWLTVRGFNPSAIARLQLDSR